MSVSAKILNSLCGVFMAMAAVNTADALSKGDFSKEDFVLLPICAIGALKSREMAIAFEDREVF